MGRFPRNAPAGEPSVKAGKGEQNEVLGNRCKTAGVYLAGRDRVCVTGIIGVWKTLKTL